MIECRRYRLQPHANQVVELNRQLGVLRRLWNRALEERQTAWRERHESIGLVQQCKSLTQWRRDDDALQSINAQASQAQLRRLDTAFKRFFKGIAAYPRFRAFGEQVSLTYPQATGNEVGARSGKIRLSGVGYVPLIQHRDAPTGELKTITVKQEGHQWYVILSYAVAEPPQPNGTIHAPVGIDLGVSSLVALNNGEAVASPRFLASSMRRVKRAQRVVSRRKKGSRNRLRAKRRLQRCHAKAARQRDDFLHKLSDDLVKRFDFIAMEDLNVKGMLACQSDLTTKQRARERALHRGIGDAGMSRLHEFIRYKSLRAGRVFILVPAKGTTQECSSCGVPANPPLTLQDRIHSCPCGKVMNRDTNAAKNILARGLAALSTLGHRGIHASGETGPPTRPRRVRRVRSMKEEPPSVVVLCDN